MDSRTRSALEDTLRQLVPPIWHSKLSRQDLEDGEKEAKRIICFIGSINLNPNNSSVAVNMMGSLLKDVLLFLHEDGNVKVLHTLFDIMEKMSTPAADRNLQLEDMNRRVSDMNNHRNLQIKDINLEVSVMNNNGFRVAVVIAVKHSLMLIKDVEAVTPVLQGLLDVITEYIGLNMTSHVFAETALSILKRSSAVIPLGKSSNFNHKILSLASTCINFPPYSGSVKHYVKISDTLVTSWSRKKMMHIFYDLINRWGWSNHECIVMAAVIRSCYDRQEVADRMNLLSIRIYYMILKKDMYVGPLKLLQTVTECLTVETWVHSFMRTLLLTIDKNTNNTNFYIDQTLVKFMTIAVRCYGAAVYKLVGKYVEEPMYKALCLYCSIQHGILDVENCRIDICRLIELGDELDHVNPYLMNILFVPDKKRVLYQWQLQRIMSFLDNDCFLASSASRRSDLHYLLSHLYINGNDTILNKENDPVAKNSIIQSYGIFLRNLHERCIYYILNGSKTAVSHSVQTLKMFHSTFTQLNLKTKYTITKSKYAPTEAPFLKWLISSQLCNFWSKAEALRLCKFYIDKPKHYPEILSLVLQWYETYCPTDKSEIEKILEAGFYFLQTGCDYDTIEKGCQRASIFIRKAAQCSEQRLEVIRLTETNFLSINVGDLSDANSMLVLVKFGYTVLKLCCSSEDSAFQSVVFEKCMGVIQKVLDLYNLSDQYNTTFKWFEDLKMTEHLMIMCLDTTLLISNMCLEQSYETIVADVLKTSFDMLEIRTMKKLVGEAIRTIRKLCTTVVALRDDRSRAVINEFLKYVLWSIYRPADSLNTKIRRSPRHRIAIYSIVVADKDNMFLDYAINFLLKVLSDAASSSDAIASALRTMGMLISDTRLKNGMYKYTAAIAVHALNAIQGEDSETRDAAVNVIECLPKHLLGWQNYLGQRRNSIKDASTFIPDLTIFSHQSCRMYLTVDLNVFTENFYKMFIGIMYSNLLPLGIFSVYAFVAVCPHIHIPILICDIVRWLNESYYSVEKHIFDTLMHLLHALYEKFTECTSVNYYELSLRVIKFAFSCLTRFLKRFNVHGFFPFIGINICGSSTAEDAIINQLKENSSVSKRWIETNMRDVLMTVSIHSCIYWLQIIIKNGCSSNSEFECMRVVESRYEELISHGLVDDLFVSIILDSFFKVASDCKDIIGTYSDVIYRLVTEGNFVMTENLLLQLRSKYSEMDMNNFGMVSSYIKCLSTVHMYTEADQAFIQKAIVAFQREAALGADVDFDTAVALEYLYKCVKESERHHIFKMALMLLMEDQTFSTICRFVADTFEVDFTKDKGVTLRNLISCENLTKQLGSQRKAMKFVINLTLFVGSLGDDYEYWKSLFSTQVKYFKLSELS